MLVVVLDVPVVMVVVVVVVGVVGEGQLAGAGASFASNTSWSLPSFTSVPPNEVQ